MTLRDSIPTFKVGERVRVYLRPYEMLCPVCGTQFRGENSEVSVREATVVPDSPLIVTITCGHVIEYPEGFYSVDIVSPRGDYTAVPYTLLEKLPVEE